jgi:hypothetical protein
VKPLQRFLAIVLNGVDSTKVSLFAVPLIAMVRLGVASLCRVSELHLRLVSVQHPVLVPL